MRRLTEDKMETASLMNGSEYTYKNGLKLLDKWICDNCKQVYETDLRVCEACGWVESTSIPNEKEIEIMDKMKMNGKFVARKKSPYSKEDYDAVWDKDFKSYPPEYEPHKDVFISKKKRKGVSRRVRR